MGVTSEFTVDPIEALDDETGEEEEEEKQAPLIKPLSLSADLKHEADVLPRLSMDSMHTRPIIGYYCTSKNIAGLFQGKIAAALPSVNYV